MSDIDPAYPEPGSAIPEQPGYVVGHCGHRVAGSEWRVGFRVCERCPAAEYAEAAEETTYTPAEYEWARKVVLSHAEDVGFMSVGDQLGDEWGDLSEDEWDERQTRVHDLALSATVTVSWDDEVPALRAEVRRLTGGDGREAELAKQIRAIRAWEHTPHGQTARRGDAIGIYATAATVYAPGTDPQTVGRILLGVAAIIVHTPDMALVTAVHLMAAAGADLIEGP